MTEIATQTQTAYTRIRADQHLDYFARPELIGKFWYVANIELEKPYIGLIKPESGESKTETFSSQADLFLWFKYEGKLPKPSIDWSDPSAVADFTNTIATPEAKPESHADDALSIMQDAQSEPAKQEQIEPETVKAESAFETDPFETASYVESPREATEAPTQFQIEPQLSGIITDLKEAESLYIANYVAADVADAEYKALLQEFNERNSELVERRKALSDARDAAEGSVKDLLVQWGTISGEKKFDEYLSVKEFEEFDIDEAQATTWAEENYPAAISKVTNQKLIADYVKKAKVNLPFVEKRTTIKPFISKKF